MNNPVANGVDQVLDAALSALDSAVATCEAAEGEKQALQTRLAEQERIYLEKVAATSTKSGLTADKIEMVLDRLEGMRLMPSDWRAKIASQLKADPDTALNLIMQLTNAYTPAHSEGDGIGKEAALSGAAETEEDPDGWAACARGEDVLVRNR